MIVLVPAYEPSAALPRLVEEVLAADPDVEVVVVDDGSGQRFAPVFDAVRRRGAEVLAHDRNLGKGIALKTGLARVAEAHPHDDVVTADADGQHTTADILRVAEALRADAAAGSPALVVGCRRFVGPVPLRSRVGNTLARGVFRVAAGWRLSDTQTGLRGIPNPMLAWAGHQPGDRFEYEQQVLLRAHRDGWATRELPIETVYLDHNASSHFRPVLDSLRVGLPLALFAASSLAAFLVDTVALLLLTALGMPLVASIVAARMLSASVNFVVNRRMVFGRRTRHGAVGQALRYALLAAALLASNVVWMTALTGFGVPLVAAKVATEAVLFVTSYGVQKRFVFPVADLVPQTSIAHSDRTAAARVLDGVPLTPRRSA